MTAGELFRHEARSLGVDLLAAQVHDRNVEVFAQNCGEPVFIEHAQLDQNPAEGPRALWLDLQCVAQLRLGDHPLGKEALAQPRPGFLCRRKRLRLAGGHRCDGAVIRAA